LEVEDFFSALEKISASPRKQYELAYQMDDLELGDVHLVEVSDRGNGSKIFVANVICQKRTKKNQQISGILFPHLKTALDKIAQEAKKTWCYCTHSKNWSKY